MLENEAWGKEDDDKVEAWQGRESSSEGRERDNENISHCIQDGGASQTCTCFYAILMDSFKVNKTVTDYP